MSVETEDTMRGDTLQIPLSQGKFALIDTTDYHLIAGRAWSSKLSGVKWYAVNGCTPAANHPNSKPRSYMHRIILQTTQTVDHQNGDGLDNRRANLRIANATENMRNRGPQGGRRLKGFYYDPSRHRFVVRINVNYKAIFVGRFKNQLDAASAYDNAALKYFGAFARLNFPKDGGL